MTTLLQSYDEHPLNADAILARVRLTPRASISELDLAFDPTGDVTDQNHIGGVAATIEMAEAAGVGPATRVADLGGGLGGPARCLALFFGCRVHVLDVSASRCHDAIALTRVVGLDDRVSVERADVAVADVPRHTYDVLWGQSAWIQFEDLTAVMRRWLPALVPAGRIAMEEAFLMRPPAGEEAAAVDELEAIWHCRLRTASTWDAQFAAAGAAITAFDNLSFLASRHFTRLLRSAQRPTDVERRSWRIALALADAGLLGYGRWIATPHLLR